MAASDSHHGRRRPNQACFNCRRKKVRCPGERPRCSSCTRLKQDCQYAYAARRQPRREPVEDRLAYLEEQLEIILGETREHDVTPIERNSNDHPPEVFGLQQDKDDSEGDSSGTSLQLDTSIITRSLDLYFEHCHRQPIWCINREDIQDIKSLTDEFVLAIIALTSRFVRQNDRTRNYSSDARSAILLGIAAGNANLMTIESLCLLSYSLFLDGDFAQGQFHLGLASQLCRCARMDVESGYTPEDAMTERKKRVFWSLQLLEQEYGRQLGLLDVPTETWRPPRAPLREFSHHEKPHHAKLPPLPRNTVEAPEIWVYTTDLSWIWSRVRQYINAVAHDELTEPWRHDSMYAIVLTDLMELETSLPMVHRYDTAKFYDQNPEALNKNRVYWNPWLKMQFTYHGIHMVLNHPFLYITASQQNPSLTIPNTFWRRSTELVVLHATWICRMLDMVSDKQYPLVDPFFAHIAAIAATVHLYYCCAVDLRLKVKSRNDLERSRQSLKEFSRFSPSCLLLETKLDQLLRIASGFNDVELNEWTPTKITLDIRLMWDILNFNCSVTNTASSSDGFLGLLLPKAPVPSANHNETFEIVAPITPQVTVDTSDGGQAALILSPNATRPTPMSAEITTSYGIQPATNESLRVNPLWLWSDPLANIDIDDPIYQDLPDPSGGSMWDFNTL